MKLLITKVGTAYDDELDAWFLYVAVGDAESFVPAASEEEANEMAEDMKVILRRTMESTPGIEFVGSQEQEV